jgi:flagella basal body P-ring formation protein FlgA
MRLPLAVVLFFFAAGHSHAAEVFIPVPSRYLDAETIIHQDDIEMQVMDDARLPATVLRDPKSILGMAAKTPLEAGKPIYKHNLTIPLLIKRNDAVLLRVFTKNISLTAQGRAMENGGEGDTIRVLNTSSRKIIEGVVTGRGEVSIRLPEPPPPQPLPIKPKAEPKKGGENAGH